MRRHDILSRFDENNRAIGDDDSYQHQLRDAQFVVFSMRSTCVASCVSLGKLSKPSAIALTATGILDSPTSIIRYLCKQLEVAGFYAAIRLEIRSGQLVMDRALLVACKFCLWVPRSHKSSLDHRHGSDQAPHWFLACYGQDLGPTLNCPAFP